MLLMTAMAGQEVSKISVDKLAESYPQRLLTCNEAGTVDVTVFQPNNEFFLCFGDSITVSHNGNQDLSGDPDPSTPPGIRYLLYNDPPTITGCDVPTLLTDPALNQTSPIFLNGGLVNIDPVTPIWSLRGDIDGNMIIRNNGVIQEAFNGGNPFALYLAPATVDDFDDSDNDGVYENGGPCLDVNVDEAFRVIWLNEVQVTILEYPNGGDFDQMRIRITGGLPEWNGSSFNVGAVLSTDATVQGVVSDVTDIPQGQEMLITVPQEGDFDLVVSDNLGCRTDTILQFIRPQDLTVAIECAEGEQGEQDCIDLTVSNFEQILSMQFTFNFDPTVIRIDTVQNFGLPEFDDKVNVSNVDGTITVVWFDPYISGVTLPDGDVLFTICFTYVGTPGDVTDLFIDGSTTPIEFGDAVTSQAIEDFTLLDCQAEIVCRGLSLASGACPSLIGERDGSFTIKAGCGTNPYTMQWSNQADPTQNGTEIIVEECGEVTIDRLNPGDYEVILIDNLGNRSDTIITIIEAAPLDPIITAIDPVCAGEANGRLEVDTVLGGIPDNAFNYEWRADDTTFAFGRGEHRNLPAGIYELIVTDRAGCMVTETVELSRDSIEINVLALQDASCSGIADGSILVAASGGAPFAGNTYRYTWDPGPTQNAVNGFLANVAAGEYIVTVEDENRCQVSDTFQLASRKELGLDVSFTPISCNGESDGCITVEGITRGDDQALPYSFQWEAGAPVPVETDSTSTICGLGRDVYNITVTDADADGCSFDTTILMLEPRALSVFWVNTTATESCDPGGDGQIIVAGNGGTQISGQSPPYDFEWGHDGSITNNVLSNLEGDSTYFVTITDANGCQDSLAIYLPIEATVEIIDTTIVDLECFTDNDGSISIEINPSQLDDVVSVTWSNGESGLTITNLTGGEYTVRVINEDNCVTAETYLVNAPDSFFIADTILREPTCAGESSGQISLIVEGGTQPLSYSWDHPNGSDNPVLPAIPAGIYNVTISDNSQCPPIVAQIELGEPDSINLDFVLIEPQTCPDNNCDGLVVVEVSGGPDPSAGYGITWENGSTIDSALNLCGGFQSITVTNTLLCGIIDSVLIPVPDPIQIAQVDSVRPSCFGFTDGSLNIMASGGNGGYIYQWIDPAVIGPQLQNIGADLYEVQITDAEGCIDIDTVILGQPDSLVLGIDSLFTNSLGCQGDDDGRITVSTSGGTPDYMYVWTDDVSTGEAASDLSQGIYDIMVTDANGCTDVTQYEVTAPVPIIAFIPTPQEPPCFGFTTELFVTGAQGGVGSPYTYTINNGPRRALTDTATVLAGEYLVSVFDNTGCSFDTMITIGQPSQIDLFVPDTFEVDLGLTVDIEAEIIHNLSIDSVLWTTMDSIQCLDALCQSIRYMPLSDETVVIEVIDANGCRVSTTTRIFVDDSRDVYVPNVFSPNGDAVNDVFQVFTKRDAEVIDFIRVYDRWGSKVYDASNVEPSGSGTIGWDGFFKGQLAPNGVYVYAVQVTFIDGQKVLFRGDVTLVR